MSLTGKEVKVMDRENNTALRKLRESVVIAKERRVMNRDEQGGGLPTEPHLQAFVYCCEPVRQKARPVTFTSRVVTV
ncbi:hypothetical protein DPMN_168437 [Dreissena polymorpha]|uniref:Uncharacterized protein n=1 Tax=Dreissena polymorpha TaxID=45954 RepID=A0A9D4F0M8_DREPO|nr:hypothetical protein DPMN_168437 [Dreissena polymorpha]